MIAIKVSGAQFSVSHLILEVALIGVALAAGRAALALPAVWIESQVLCCCIALTAGCGALSGLFLRMALGLIAGAVLAVVSIPLLWLLMSAA